MSFKSWCELIITIFLLAWGANFLFIKVIINNKRDLSDIALNEQSNITSVRKKNETALYRNFLVPIGFPLTTGLGLSLGYKIRNGNFMDVWKAIMDVTIEKNNYIKFNNRKKYTLSQINGAANHIIKEVYEKYDVNEVGVNISVSSFEGFVISIASMIHSIRNSEGKGLMHYLTSVPRQRLSKVDVLVIDSWQSFRMLNKSEEWYKLIIVCDNNENVLKPKDSKTLKNVKTWSEIIRNYTEEPKFEYDPPTDNADELKLLLNITTSSNETTSFNQLNLVSSISAFIKTFPLDNELSSRDIITEICDPFSLTKKNLQVWSKVLSVLLHGGSAQFILDKEIDLDAINDTTLLIANPKALSDIAKTIKDKYPSSSLFSSINQSFSTTLLSEGIMNKLSKLNVPQLQRLRSIYLAEELINETHILSFDGKIPKRTKGQIKEKFTTTKLNYFRSLFGCRLVVELYCPYIIMGPISQTNFYDYRIFPKVVDENVTCVGSMTTTLEGKIVQTEENSELDIENRQGMLCVRGFTIGRPVTEKRLQDASTMSTNIAGGEGWIPLVGVFGLWGQDGCLYIYN
ncbi:similar to Saccharomyces cerevisiae YHR045W Putative protein of unknown function [Maudiozyma barnettii]|uniref:Uncharacterized protein n=1 Tax=Maudiozyma barnettii TaxID=61262 RepID=A0A8H2VBU0_9SACH|nr:hypothetical protein [Kazachstania barnettii]CAB4252378.1 similar to Saccharomyces cerevisiae YHR045W Putative protein of unknown function [Kazachstania barnettii]CAD1779113.1 similar to Saccharomyces cerevisiae YHR045W Putative protein of unknown function [Kazachstania barnettii]